MARRNTKTQWSDTFSEVKTSETRLGGGVTYQGVSFPGGLDMTTPTLSLRTGALRDVQNFEVNQTGGYSRTGGYERFSGLPAPSDASFQIMQLTSAGFTTVPEVGDQVFQESSGATGYVAFVVNDAVTPLYYLVLTDTDGTFDYTSDILLVGGEYVVTALNSPLVITASNSPFEVTYSTVGVATTTTVVLTNQEFAQYNNYAADIYRDRIEAVPGGGNVLDVVTVSLMGSDYVFAFRATTDASQVKIWQASVTGWVNVPLMSKVNFTLGGGVIDDGDTIMQGTTVGTIMRAMQASGDPDASTAAGLLVIDDVSGGSFAAGIATTSSGGSLTLASALVAITILPGGLWEHVKANFTGSAATKRVYFVDGVNQAGEFDGTTYAPITTGVTMDAPDHVAFHQNALMLAQDSSLLVSSPGFPYLFLPIDGGGEYAVGYDVTGLATLPGSNNTATLGVFQRESTSFLYGTSISDFKLISFNQGTGAIPYTTQNMFDTFVLDNLGVISVTTSLNFGNFASTTLTKNILPFIQQERTKVTSSAVRRDKSQYRVFFSDGFALYVTIVNQQYLGASVINFLNPVNCVDEGETLSGNEVSYFGSNDGGGYVYQMDVGTSFDGENIDAHATLAWDVIRSPRLLKQFKYASLEMSGATYAAVDFGYQLGFGVSDISQPTTTSYTSNFSEAYWDNFTWDAFWWDGQTVAPTEIELDGQAVSIQVTITSSTDYMGSYSINSIIYHYSPLRNIR